MKVLIYNYANFGYFFIEAIKHARERSMDIDWSALVLSDNFVSLYADIIGTGNTFYIHPKLNAMMKNKKVDLNELKDYPESIYKSLLCDKGEGKLRRKNREYKLRYACSIYTIYKEILETGKFDFVFFPIIESTDAVILLNLCKEKNIEPIIYEWARNYGVPFFSDSINEKLPSYVKPSFKNDKLRNRSIEFITNFRKGAFRAEYSHFGIENIIEFKRESVIARLLKYMQKTLLRREPHNVSDKSFVGKTMTNCQPLCCLLRRIHSRFTKKYFDITVEKDAPEAFIYFPLHVEPEMSINILAPYFVDQLRVVDLILENMPSTFYLLIKEHPSMAGIRTASFYRSLKKRAGVVLADHSIDNLSLIKKAACTISVTGTACLEAFLLGKPSIQLGDTFFSDSIYRFDSFYDFKNIVREAINNTEVDLEKIIDLTSRVFSIGYDFVIFSPGDPGLEPSWVMNKKNIGKFLNALSEHMMKTRTHENSNY